MRYNLGILIVQFIKCVYFANSYVLYFTQIMLSIMKKHVGYRLNLRFCQLSESLGLISQFVD